MTKYNYLIILFLLFNLAAIAQEPAKEEKQNYVSPEGDLYVNKALPVYLFLSTSPDPNADAILLKSEVSKNYVNPMYLYNDGKNLIYSPSCVDTVTKQTILPLRNIFYDIFGDGSAPKTDSKFEDSPKYLKDGKTYFNPNLKINIQSKDFVSGVKQTYISTNAAAFQSVNSPLSFKTDTKNDYTIKYYSVDNVGNVEPIKETSFIIDRKPPETRYVIQGVQSGENVLSEDSYIELKTTDDLSGVKAVFFAIDKGDFKPYPGEIALGNVGDGEHTVRYYSVDNVGNDNKRQSTEGLDGNVIDFLKFEIDRKPPITSVTYDGDQYQGKYLYVSDRTKVKLKSSDKESGTAFIYYGVNQPYKTKTFEEPFTLPNKNGLYQINYAAMDNVKNLSPAKKDVVYLDNESPTTAISFKSPQFFDRDTLFLSKNSKVLLNSWDNASGVKKVEYALDNDEYKTYEGSIPLTTTGYHKVKFRSSDNVNNSEQIKESEFVIDDIAPEIYAGFSVKPIGTDTKEGQTYSVYPTYTRIYLGATDRYSGTETLLYSIDGGPLVKYSTSQSIADTNLLTKEKFYTVKVVARDKLGNESEKEVKFFVKKK